MENWKYVITQPSFQEETGIVLALVFPSSSNRPRSFKHMPVLAVYHVIDFRQIHCTCTCTCTFPVVNAVTVGAPQTL